jgi:hypothetical protein
MAAPRLIISIGPCRGGAHIACAQVCMFLSCVPLHTFRSFALTYACVSYYRQGTRASVVAKRLPVDGGQHCSRHVVQRAAGGLS